MNKQNEPIKVKVKPGEIEEILKEINYRRDIIKKGKDPFFEEFEYHVKKCGNASHIPLGKKWINRFVKVRVEEVKE